MPKARRSSRPRSEPDENARNLSELALFLEDGEGFRLALATYDIPATREAQLDKLAEVLASHPIHISRLDLSHTPNEKQLLQRIRDHIRDNPAPEEKMLAVMVTGLEATLDYRKLGPEAAEGLAILQNANIQRDAFPKICPVPVVLWLNPSTSTKFAQVAPDLWHWRSGTFHFAGPPRARDKLARTLVQTTTWEMGHLGPVEWQDRIAMLKDLLLDLENGDDQDAPANQARRAALQFEIGTTCLGNSNFDRAIEYFHAALNLYRTISDHKGEVLSLVRVGTAYILLGRASDAIGYLEQALAITHETGNRLDEGFVLRNLGVAYIALGRMDDAIGYLERALAITRETGDRYVEPGVLRNLGAAYTVLGRMEESIGYFERALAIARETGDRHGEGFDLGNLGAVHTELGRVEESIGYFERALQIGNEIEDDDIIQFALSGLKSVEEARAIESTKSTSG